MDGNSSVLLEMTPGCHGEHAKHYIRRVQVNKNEEAGIEYKKHNPKMITDSVWSNNNTDWCLSFPITAKEGSILKKDLLGVKQLEVVKLLFENWIVAGQRDPKAKVQNNVSNTVQVPEGHWDMVEDYVWDNQNELAGVSFIASLGDMDFNQPPYSEVLMPDELLAEYGEGMIFASGLIVDLLSKFGDLWKACDVFYGRGEKLFTSDQDVQDVLANINTVNKEDYLSKPLSEYEEALKKQDDKWYDIYITRGYSPEFARELVCKRIAPPESEIRKYLDESMFGSVPKLAEKRDLIRRIRKFGCKFFNCDMEKTIRALKHVQLYHDWCEITKTSKEIDWSKVKWRHTLVAADTTAAASCNGGACEITKI